MALEKAPEGVKKPPIPLTEIMRQLWPAQSKKGFWDLLPGKNPQKFLFLKPNPLVDAMIAKASLKKEFFQKFEHTTPPEPR